jgi:hypothetical protein
MIAQMLWLLLMTVAYAETLGERTVRIAGDFVDDVGPRQAGSPGAIAAQAWVSVELEARGWIPTVLPPLRGGDGAVVACRDGRVAKTLLILAHTDAVHAECPGANDNAAAVAALMVVAEQLEKLPQRRVCLGFPDGEEFGFLGALRLREEHDSGRLDLGELDHVLALDLIGIGEPTHHGLGKKWGTDRLRALLEAAPAEVPWVYRAVAWAMPSQERSDHAAFIDKTVPTSMMLARGKDGIYLDYHTRKDTLGQLDVHTLERQIGHLLAIAKMAPLPENDGADPALVVPWTFVVVPGWLVRFILWGGLGAGLASVYCGPRSFQGVWRVIWLVVAGTSSWVAMTVAQGGRDASMALAEWVVPSAWAGMLVGWVGLSPRMPRPMARRLAALAAVGVGGTLALLGHPLLAVPFAATGWGCLAVALRPGLAPVAALISLWPAVYLVRPVVVRELSFHGLVPVQPLFWCAILAVLTIPAAVLAPGDRLLSARWRWTVLLFLCCCLLGAWLSPEFTDAYPQWKPLHGR